MYIYAKILLISSQNEKYCRQTLQRKSKHNLCLINLSEYRAGCDMMRESMLELNRTQLTA